MGDKVRIRMPSGSLKDLPASCRATIGVLGGHGRTDKPLMKAGAAPTVKRLEENSTQPSVVLQ